MELFMISFNAYLSFFTAIWRCIRNCTNVSTASLPHFSFRILSDFYPSWLLVKDWHLQEQFPTNSSTVLRLLMTNPHRYDNVQMLCTSNGSYKGKPVLSNYCSLSVWQFEYWYMYCFKRVMGLTAISSHIYCRSAIFRDTCFPPITSLNEHAQTSF